MTIPVWHEKPIAKKHNRQDFDCGQPELNAFLRDYAQQSHERGAAKTCPAIDDVDGKTVYGYYSLSPASIEYARTPEVLRRALGRYEVGAFRLGRLASHIDLHGQGLGGQLLLAAGRRCLRVAEEVGGTAMLIDAKNEQVATWYASYGALALLDAPLTLLLPLNLVAAAIKTSGKFQ
ncbi:MAG: GNAT family N-acetyltransferase [Comamonadaceae bacterium CG_4_9_14_3_um_filter_60_33]|nr:MAG: GNAT family N-acetyltransferase [Comamonadaceae bacterium CG2_30_59_20]PIY30198.1 MAG: GNAT family N-acetyltransferase [Comamonadaceae bacterium CG_4_10_14_3_um_filter_60_42]PIZ22660.1 MAG: GNAT family N-acetyltransferase [Comamonadaceae bacterium CG_4_10_14_0_8_um_filter_57_29]PJB41109.1 MAG: GNAT family N-acetyltransferase [Comamonadaceae bacterium CG_4_9_14_3_um_filter_60_33]